MKRRLYRICTMLVTVAMIFSLMPVAAMADDGQDPSIIIGGETVNHGANLTGKGTSSSPYVVLTWDALKTCLNKSRNEANEKTIYVKLGQDLTLDNPGEINVDPENGSEKYVLNLNGKTIQVNKNNANQIFTVKNSISFRVEDSDGRGRIIDGSWKNHIFYAKDSATLEITGGTFSTVNTDVIYLENSGHTVLTIDGGYFTGYNHAIRIGSFNTVYFRGGTYKNLTPNTDHAVIHNGSTRSVQIVTRSVIIKRQTSGTLVKNTNWKSEYQNTLRSFWNDNETRYDIPARAAILLDGIEIAQTDSYSILINSKKEMMTIEEAVQCVLVGKMLCFDRKYYSPNVSDVDLGNAAYGYRRSNVIQPINIHVVGMERCQITNVTVSSSSFEIKAPSNTSTVYSDGDSVNGYSVQPVNGLDAGKYEANIHVFYIGASGLLESVRAKVSFTVDMIKVTKPRGLQTVFSYDGSEHALYIGSYDTTYIDRSGDISKIEKGEYSTVYTLKDTRNMCWEDGTNQPVTITWSIAEPTTVLNGVVNYTNTAMYNRKFSAYVSAKAGDYGNTIPADKLHGQWQRSTDGGVTWSDIGGEVSISNPGYAPYTPTAQDVGHYIRFKVTADGYKGELTGNVREVYKAPAPDTALAVPVIIEGPQHNVIITNTVSNQEYMIKTTDSKPEEIEWETAAMGGSDITGSKDMSGKTVYVFYRIAGDQVTEPGSEVEFVSKEFSEGSSGESGGFVDVSIGDYFYEAVNWAVQNGITSGMDASHFNPNGICTRAQAVTFLWRANGSPAPHSSVMPFADVKKTSYYYDAVLWAIEQGITVGTSDTTFSPDLNCTRAQIVTMLHRAAGTPGASAALFSDVPPESYYANAVQWAVANGITNGTTETTFSPDEQCTRAQIVTFIFRQLNKAFG